MLAFLKFCILIFDKCIDVLGLGSFLRAVRAVISPSFSLPILISLCRKDQPIKWSEVAGSSDVNITTTQCEAYVAVNQAHEYEEIPTNTAQQPPGPEYEIPVTKCPAYVPTSERDSGRVEETVYEPV